MLRREAERLGYRSTFTIYDQADQVRVVRACLEDLGVDPKRFTPARHPQPDLEREEPADRPGRVHEPRRLVLRQDVAEVYERYQQRLHRLERGRLRRHADAHGRGARALPGRRSPTGSTRSATSSSTSTRTRTTPSTGCCSCSPAEHGNVFAVGRPGSVGLRLPRRRHQQHPRLRARLPGRAARSRSSRTTAPRTRSSAPPTR